MMKCCNCGNENLIIPKKESKLIKDGKYAACSNCGKIMIVINSSIIPTPTSDSPITKALIQDATNCFNEEIGTPVVSLEGENIDINMQPSQTKKAIEEYVMAQFEQLNACNCIECEDDKEVKLDEECKGCNGACSECDQDEFDELESSHECTGCNTVCTDDCDNCGCPKNNKEKVVLEFDNEVSLELVENQSDEKGNYLLLLPEGKKELYMNSSKTFVLNIINSIGVNVRLFELNEIKLKQEIKYTF